MNTCERCSAFWLQLKLGAIHSISAAKHQIACDSISITERIGNSRLLMPLYPWPWKIPVPTLISYKHGIELFFRGREDEASSNSTASSLSN
jgi:hypothetical protein